MQKTIHNPPTWDLAGRAQEMDLIITTGSQHGLSTVSTHGWGCVGRGVRRCVWGSYDSIYTEIHTHMGLDRQGAGDGSNNSSRQPAWSKCAWAWVWDGGIEGGCFMVAYTCICRTITQFQQQAASMIYQLWVKFVPFWEWMWGCSLSLHECLLLYCIYTCSTYVCVYSHKMKTAGMFQSCLIKWCHILSQSWIEFVKVF